MLCAQPAGDSLSPLHALVLILSQKKGGADTETYPEIKLGKKDWTKSFRISESESKSYPMLSSSSLSLEGIALRNVPGVSTLQGITQRESDEVEKPLGGRLGGTSGWASAFG